MNDVLRVINGTVWPMLFFPFEILGIGFGRRGRDASLDWREADSDDSAGETQATRQDAEQTETVNRAKAKRA